MKQNLVEQLDKLERIIDSQAFISEVSSVKEWDGADVIISSRLTDDIRKWLAIELDLEYANASQARFTQR